MTKTKLSRNAKIALFVVPFLVLTAYAGIRSYHDVMGKTVPAISNKIDEEYRALVRDLDMYDRSSGVFTTDIKRQLASLGSDLYVLAGGDPRFSSEVSELVRLHGDTFRMLSPTYQAILFCSTYKEKCKDMLNFIIQDLMSRKK